MPATTYTAIIRWRGPDPTLELETRHTGFASPEEAALYANGVPPRSPALLHLLADGSAVFVLNDETEVACQPDQLEAWAIPANSGAAEGPMVVVDDDYQPLAQGQLVVCFAAHGDYLQAQYGVFDANEVPVDVRVDWDDTDHLRVTVVDTPAPVLHQTSPTLDWGVLPDA